MASQLSGNLAGEIARGYPNFLILPVDSIDLTICPQAQKNGASQ